MLRNRTINESILLDVTYANTPARVHMRTGRADRNVSAASTSGARKRKHYAPTGQVCFDECSYKLATLAVENVGRLEKEGSDIIDVAATA